MEDEQTDRNNELSSEVGDGGGDEKVSEWDEWRSIGPSSLIPLSTDSGQGLKSTESMVQTNGE